MGVYTDSEFPYKDITDTNSHDFEQPLFKPSNTDLLPPT